MDRNDYWKNKIQAFLHDPFDKAFIIATRKMNHEERANEILQKFNISISEDIQGLINLADHISAGIDRPLYEEIKDISIRGIGKLVILNPLTGDILPQKFESIDKENIDKNSIIEMSTKKILDNLKDKKDYKNLFISIWASYPEILSILDEEIGDSWKYLPADTRLPYHSIFTHLQSTSAIFSSLPNLGFLYFSLGPVQDFIETSRKTQDLWASSLLLSFLSWKGIEVIFEELGPDHICYPYLKKQAFVLDKLKDFVPKEIIPKDLDEKLLIPSLPNKFLSIIPFEKSEELGEKVLTAITSQFNEISEFIFNSFLEFLKSANINSQGIEKIEKQWNEQINNFLEFNYLTFPWGFKPNEPKELEDEEKVKEYINNLIKTLYTEDSEDEIKKIFANLNNIGCTYGFHFGIIERLMGSRKLLRNFNQLEQTGDKCSLCGKNSALYPYSELDRRSNYRDFWKLLSKQATNKGKIGLFKEDGSERLCAIEIIKRMYTEYTKKKKVFPSTYSISATTFLNKAIKVKDGEELIRKVSEVDNEKSGYYPKLLYDKIKSDIKDDLPDGSYFFISELEMMKEGKAIIQEINKFRKNHKDIYSYLIPYYAIIKFDGDNMGKWISGEIEEFPLIDSVIHPECEKGNLPKELLNKKLQVSSALHLFISMNLCEFSQNTVPSLVDKNYGSLIYSGGDDILAFVPVEYVFDLAKEIREAFSEPEAMGSNATCSAGIVIAHMSTPLSYVMNKVRTAEIDAKKLYEDKDSFKIILIRGSGGESSVGEKWFYNSANKQKICSLDFIKLISVLFDSEGADLQYLRKSIYKEHFPHYIGKIYFSPAIVKDLESEKYFLTEKEQIASRIETLLNRHTSFYINPENRNDKEKIKEFKEKGLEGIKNIIFDFFEFCWNNTRNIPSDSFGINSPIVSLIEFMKIARFVARKGGE